MTITFLKDHKKYKADETAEVPDNTAFFLLRCRVATIKAKDEKTIEKALNKKLKSTKKSK